MQTLIVALLVAGCAGYALWVLMPAAARRGIALRLIRLPLPAGFATRMRKAAAPSTGCGCDGCDHAPSKQSPPGAPGLPSAPQPLTFHPRARR